VNAAAILAVDGVRLSRGDVEVLRGVTLAVARGEFVALMGLSGGGKTTLLRAVTALEPFQAGTVDLDGFRLTPATARRESALRELRRKVALVFQQHGLFEHLTVLHNVTLAPLHVHRAARRQAEERALSLLEDLGVSHRRNAFPRELSGGEAQRVAIARALAVDPPLLLMEEPTASLDPARRHELGETLQGMRDQGRTLLVTTHDDDFVRDFATRVVILAEGEVVEDGKPAVVLTNPSHPATRRLLQGPRKQESLPAPR
jgi:ABC-type polar amino acid transport system ATPase subunit